MPMRWRQHHGRESAQRVGYPEASGWTGDMEAMMDFALQNPLRADRHDFRIQHHERQPVPHALLIVQSANWESFRE